MSDICIECECGQPAALLVTDQHGLEKAKAYLLCCSPAAKPCARELSKRALPWVTQSWPRPVTDPRLRESTRWHRSIDDAIAQWREMHGGGR